MIFKGMKQSQPSLKEEVELAGYAVVPGYYWPDLAKLRVLADSFYTQEEVGVVRNPLLRDRSLRTLAHGPEIILDLLGWPYILHTQRFVIADPGIEHSAGVWHRDLPYQQFTSSKPIAITTLLCIDPMSDNGPLYILEGSHKWEECPSDKFIETHERKLSLEAGDLLVFNSALLHRNSINESQDRRRSLVTIYTNPMIKQHTDIASRIVAKDEFERVIFGLTTRPHNTDKEYLDDRARKSY